jgi:hypothetical protein
MKNPAPYLRQKIGDVLDTNVVYNSAVIPVYGNDEDHDDPLQIVIGEYSDADASNKENFQCRGSQVIEVISFQSTGAKKTVDAVGELVMDLIHPTTKSEVLSGTDFQVLVVGKPSQNHLIEQDASGGKIVRLILRYNFLININS